LDRGKEVEAMMNPKERWLRVLRREPPDRLPMFYSATPEATQKLMRHLGVDGMDALYDRLHIDEVIRVQPAYRGPPISEGTTLFGARYNDIHYEGGVYRGIDGHVHHHPLARCETIEEIEKNYSWPDPDWWDYSVIPGQIEGREDAVILGGGSEPFMDYKEQLRGPERAYMDLIDKPEIVHYCLDRLYALCHENTRRIFEAVPGRIFACYVAEDLGTQEHLLCSCDHIREYFIPRMRRMIDLAHGAGVHVLHHSDGAIREILPDMIEAGIDMLNPVQWRCRGMDREGLKRDFGDRVVFHGAVDNQYTLAFGTAEEVRQEVADNIRILGGGGGYILGPCHNIQVVSPPENIVAMYEAGYELGKTG
jgi:uroporphyrinogen decarboxylase